MNRHATFEALRFLVLLSYLFPMETSGQTSQQPSVAKLDYELVPDFFQLPPGENFVESAGIAVNSKGHIYVFHRGKHPLMEFDATGGFVRSIADDLFVSAHAVRVDASDNIWTADVGSHVVLKLSPEGRVLLALGRMRIPGDDVAHFNQPTDVAFDRAGNIYVTDGYGNSRVLKFDKYGNFLTSWGMKGSAPGQFDLPHTIAIDGDLVYVGDRENARIQIFDTNGRFLKEWRDVGHPFGLFITPDHAIYMCDAIAGRILKLSTEGGILGIYGEHGRGPGRLGDPHQLTVGKDGSIFTANVVNWRPQKFRPSKAVAEFRPNDSPRARRYENADPRWTNHIKELVLFDTAAVREYVSEDSRRTRKNHEVAEPGPDVEESFVAFTRMPRLPRLSGRVVLSRSFAITRRIALAADAFNDALDDLDRGTKHLRT